MAELSAARVGRGRHEVMSAERPLVGGATLKHGEGYSHQWSKAAPDNGCKTPGKC